MNILRSLFTKKEEPDFKELIKNGAIVIDVRSKEEFNTGHIVDAINIPLDVLSSKVTSVGGATTQIITCCMSGGRSAMAKSVLEASGYTHVYNGGGWKTLQSKLG